MIVEHKDGRLMHVSDITHQYFKGIVRGTKAQTRWSKDKVSLYAACEPYEEKLFWFAKYRWDYISDLWSKMSQW